MSTFGFQPEEILVAITMYLRQHDAWESIDFLVAGLEHLARQWRKNIVPLLNHRNKLRYLLLGPVHDLIQKLN